MSLPEGGLQVLLLQIVAILAAEVAERPCGFSHHIKRTGKGISCTHNIFFER